jgi:type VI secretion system protein ImpB
VAMSVQNRLTDENTNLKIELNFKSMDDFDPGQIAEQVPALKEMLEMRMALTQLLSKMEGNDKLDRLLAEVLSNTDTARELARHMGVGQSDRSTAQTPELEAKS